MTEKKVHRSKHNRIIGGVAGGLAEYFGTDPVIIRIIFLFLAFGGGAGVLLYIILWAMIPEQGHTTSAAEEVIVEEMNNTHHPVKHHRGAGNNIIGFFLVIVGLLFLFDNIFPSYSVEKFWPIILIFFGLAIMFRERR